MRRDGADNKKALTVRGVIIDTISAARHCEFEHFWRGVENKSDARADWGLLGIDHRLDKSQTAARTQLITRAKLEHLAGRH